MDERLLLLRAAGHCGEWALILLPVAIYLAVLGLGVNRMRRPVVISGSGNLLGVALALSGFFLIGPPTWIIHPLRGSGPMVYGVAYAGYLLIVGLIGLWLMMTQARTLVIYNVNPSVFAQVLQETLEEMKLPYSAAPGRISLAEQQLVLDISTSFLWNNVLLQWRGTDPGLRAAIEEKLRVALANVESEPNPGSTLLVLLAVTLFSLIFFLTAVFVLLGSQ